MNADMVTIDDGRVLLERAIDHAVLLLADAKVCGLKGLARRRRQRLRQLRSMLADLDAEGGGGTREDLPRSR